MLLLLHDLMNLCILLWLKEWPKEKARPPPGGGEDFVKKIFSAVTLKNWNKSGPLFLYSTAYKIQWTCLSVVVLSGFLLDTFLLKNSSTFLINFIKTYGWLKFRKCLSRIPVVREHLLIRLCCHKKEKCYWYLHSFLFMRIQAKRGNKKKS